MTRIPAPALALSLAGLAPFVAGALLMFVDPERFPDYGVLPPPRALGLHVLEQYGAVILAFMGGCLWGFASAPGRLPTFLLLACAVTPALLAFAAIRADAARNCLWLAFGFVVLQAIDVGFHRAGVAPAWWLSLRLPLTATVIACLLVGALYG